MDTKIFDEKYWTYYLELENEFKQIEKYIPINKTNNKTFSYKYMKLLFSICSEIDTIFKSFIKFNDENTKSINKLNIKDYRNFIKEKFKKFQNEIIIYKNKREIKPFEKLNSDKSPDWWHYYNNIKHTRCLLNENSFTENFKKANQINMLNALAGLYQLETYYYYEIINKENSEEIVTLPLPQSEYFRIKNWKGNIPLIDNRYMFKVEDNGDLYIYGDIYN